jgi:hypothetical protein
LLVKHNQLVFIMNTIIILIIGSHGVMSPKSQVTRGQSMHFNRWEHVHKLGLTTSYGIPNPPNNTDGLHCNIFCRWGLGLVSRVWLSKMLNPTLNTNPMNVFAYSYQDMIFMIINHSLMVSRDSKLGTLPPCWDHWNMWLLLRRRTT